MLKRIIAPFLAWLVGSISWSIIWYSMTRIRPDEPMILAIGMIGLLVLIVVGIVWVGWYFSSVGMGSIRLLQLENMARIITAVYLSQKYDVPVEELPDTMTPQEMEERAKRIQAEKELAQLRGNAQGC